MENRLHLAYLENMLRAVTYFGDFGVSPLKHFKCAIKSGTLEVQKIILFTLNARFSFPVLAQIKNYVNLYRQYGTGKNSSHAAVPLGSFNLPNFKTPLPLTLLPIPESVPS